MKNNKTIIIFLLLYIIISGLTLWDMKDSFFYNHIVLDEKNYLIQSYKLLKNGLPEEPFYQAPLFPIFISFIFKIFGNKIILIRLINIFFGTLSLFLTYKISQLITKEKFIQNTVLFLYTFCGIFYFYQTTLLKVSTGIFFMLVFLYSIMLFIKHKKLFYLIISGTALGILSMIRENSIIIILSPILYLITKKRIKQIVIFILFFIIPLLPISIFNSVKSGKFVLSSTQAFHNLYIGNNPNAYGRYSYIKGIEGNPIYQKECFKKIEKKKTSSYWLKKTITFAIEQKKQFIKLILIKIALFFNDYEVPNNRNFYFEKYFYAQIFNFLPISFGILFPLSLVGVCASLRKKQHIEFHYILLSVFIIYAFSVIAFYILSRYRIFVYPILIIYASLGLHYMVSTILKRKIKNILIIICILTLTAIVNFHIVEIDGKLNSFPYFKRQALYDKEFSYVLYNIGAVYYQNKDYKNCINVLKLAIDLNPSFYKAYQILGIVYKKTGNSKQAEYYSKIAKKYLKNTNHEKSH